MCPFQSSWRSSLVLLGVVVTAGGAGAQPSVVTFRTLEARIAQADGVAVGSIAKISRVVLVAPGARSPEGILQPDGVFDYTITVKVDEVLKGNLPARLEDLRPVEALRFGKHYDDWVRAGTALLWFVGPPPQRAGERRDWEFLRLGEPVPAEAGYSHPFGPPLFAADLTALKDAKDVLARARAYAKTSTKVLPTHVIRIPPAVSRQCGSSGPWNDLVVPVEPALEPRAQRLIASPADFLPGGAKLDPLARYQLRFGGVNSLRYFQSDANVALLRTLLDDPLEEFDSGFVRQYPVHTRAYEILLGWDVDVAAPKSAAATTALDLAGTQISDAGLKRLAGLTNLASLDLRDTPVTDRGLRELAGLKNLTSLHLTETQVTDAALRALRTIGLLHALAQASARGDHRPKSAADVRTLELARTAVTDAGLKELAALPNLTWLNLSDTRVTGAGLKELAGLKNLTTLYLRQAPVQDAGLKGLAGLQHLTTLDLSHTQVTDAGLKELAGLNNLAVLDLSDTPVTGVGLKELAGLKSLTTLRLSGAQVTDAGLRALRELGMLHALGAGNAGGGQPPRSDEAVTEVCLASTRVTDAGLKELAGLSALKHLDLRGTQVTGAGLKDLAGLGKLTDLFLDGTALTAAGLKELAGLKALATLHLHGKDVTDARLRALREVGMLHVLYGASARASYPPATLPPRARSDDAVRALDLGGWHVTEGTVVTDAGLKELAGLKNLAVLDLTHTPVTGTGLKELAGLKKLTRLSLGGPQVTDAGLKDLGQLTNLTALGLHDTQMTSAGLKELAGLKKLTTLHLSGKAVTDAWLSELAGFANLTTLRLYWTTVTDAGVAGFQKARPQCAIDR